MRKNHKYKWMFFVFILAAHALLFCDVNEGVVNCERIKIEPHELLITEKGLFLVKDNDAFPLNAVFADVDGLYVILEIRREDKIWDQNEKTCWNGHKIYCPCGGCANWICHFRCKCHSPWSSKN